MPVTSDKPAPYAPASAIVSIIERHRNRGLPFPVDADTLARAGVSESLIPRTLQALQTLDLIANDGGPTEMLESIRLAPEAEYKKYMEDWLRVAYADALQFIDPATATETEVRDAFRSYKPTGQQNRMVTLFIGLFAAAGVAPEKPKPVPQGVRAKQAAAKSRSQSGRSKVQPQPDAQPRQFDNNLPPALTGLLASLPRSGEGWSQDRRNGFVTAFGYVLDYLYPIIEPDDDGEDAV
ncbi:MAG: hypothetical protein DHS20C03_35180 [Minwuia thermotolerans]|nr:MAG: hypothetical protein DHS20C03_35180 [Minwuia thermotolerans]